MPVAAIVLAAGQGTRMHSDAAEGAAPARLGAADRPRAGRGAGARARAHRRRRRPRRRRGRGRGPRRSTRRSPSSPRPSRRAPATRCSRPLPALDGFAGDALVLYGDTPLIRPETLRRMLDARAAGADIVVLGFEAADPGRLRPAGRRRRRIAPGDRRGPRRDPGRAGDHPLQLRHPRRRPRHAARPARRGPPRQRQGRILSDRRGEARPRPRADGAGHHLPRGRDPRRQLSRRPRRRRGRLPGPRPRRGDGQRRDADRPGDRLVRARHRGRPRRRRSARTWSSAPRSPSSRAR